MGIAFTILVALGLFRLVAQPTRNAPQNVLQIFVQLFFIDYLWAIVEHIFRR